MSKRLRGLVLALALAVPLVVAACSSGGSTGSTTGAASSGKPSASTSSGDGSKGKAVYDANCAACHGKNAEGLVGPDLRKIGSKYDKAYLTKWIKDPESVKAGTSMPKVPLNDKELEEVVEFLLTLK